jgi:transcriptional regulator with XRE-family HTH domain
MEISSLGKAIMERRKDLGITQSRLAELADININTLYKLEKGQANPTLDVLVKIADILGMELRLEVKRKP